MFTNANSKIIQIVSRVLLLVILVLIPVFLTSCDTYTVYYVNATHDQGGGIYMGPPYSLIATLEKNVFMADDVSFDISYSLNNLYKRSSWLKGFDNVQDPYDYEGKYYALYICGDENSILKGNKYPNYAQIEGSALINTVSKDEAKSEAYGRIKDAVPAFADPRSNFNHTQRITVPSEYLSNEQGKISILLLEFCRLEKQDGTEVFVVQNSFSLVFRYQKLEDGSIKLSFINSTKEQLVIAR